MTIISSHRSKALSRLPAAFRKKLPLPPLSACIPARNATSQTAAVWSLKRSWRTCSGNKQRGLPWKRSSGMRTQRKTSGPWWKPRYTNNLRLSTTTRQRCEVPWPPKLQTRFPVWRFHISTTAEPMTTKIPLDRAVKTSYGRREKMRWVSMKLLKKTSAKTLGWTTTNNDCRHFRQTVCLRRAPQCFSWPECQRPSLLPPAQSLRRKIPSPSTTSGPMRNSSNR